MTAPAGCPRALQDEARRILTETNPGIINKYSKALALCADIVSDSSMSEDRRKLAREALNQFRVAR